MDKIFLAVYMAVALSIPISFIILSVNKNHDRNVRYCTSRTNTNIDYQECIERFK